jgi:hypothetical protein
MSSEVIEWLEALEASVKIIGDAGTDGTMGRRGSTGPTVVVQSKPAGRAGMCEKKNPASAVCNSSFELNSKQMEPAGLFQTSSEGLSSVNRNYSSWIC